VRFAVAFLPAVVPRFLRASASIIETARFSLARLVTSEMPNCFALLRKVVTASFMSLAFGPRTGFFTAVGFFLIGIIQ